MKRYKQYAIMVEDPDGPWVRYDDVEAERAVLIEALREIQAFDDIHDGVINAALEKVGER